MTPDELTPDVREKLTDLNADVERRVGDGGLPDAEFAVDRNPPRESPLKIVLDGSQATLRRAEAKHTPMDA